MVDSVALMGSGAVAPLERASTMSQPAALDASETRIFSVLMEGGIPSSSAPTKAASVESTPLLRAVAAEGLEFREQFRSLEQKKLDLMNFDSSDPTMNMVKIAEFSHQSTSVFAQLNMATSMATAVQNSFGTLLKNQG